MASVTYTYHIHYDKIRVKNINKINRNCIKL